MRAESESSLINQVIDGKYRVDELIARGDRALVFRAEQLPLGRTVALKVLRSAGPDGGGEEFRKRFFREANTLSRLQHPNVVAMFDYGRVESLGDDVYYIAMEHLVGETLAERLRVSRRIEPLAAIGIMRQVARALRAAHGLKVIHRDLKPSNVMLAAADGEPLVKVVDFGIVKVLSEDPDQLTSAGTMLGTAEYTPPEQIEGRAVDARADVYAFGTIFYEMLCGRTPFIGTQPDVLSQQLHKAPPPPSTVAPDVPMPPEVERFLMRCLAKNPAARPADMDEVLSALAACEGAIEALVALPPRAIAASARPPLRSEPRLSRAPTRRSDPFGTVAWALFVVGMVVLALGLFRYFSTTG